MKLGSISACAIAAFTKGRVGESVRRLRRSRRRLGLRAPARAIAPIGCSVLVLLACASVPAHPRPQIGSRPRAVCNERAQRTPSTLASAVALGPVATPSELATLDLAERIGSYAARDAAWVPTMPIAVGRDFEFGLALSVDVVGAGIAAARRRQDNAALAQQLSGVGSIDPRAMLGAVCAARVSACSKLVGRKIRVYGVLFGAPVARLRVTLELDAAELPTPLFTAISDAHKTEEFAQSELLSETFETTLRRALALIEQAPAGAHEAAASGDCAAGGNARIAGEIIRDEDGYVLLAASDPRPTVISCPADAFAPRNPMQNESKP
jgi:hypothetical protein